MLTTNTKFKNKLTPVMARRFMTASNLTQGANLTLKKGEIVTFAQKAIAAPSIVEIDKQPQLNSRNEQLCLPEYSRYL